MHTMEYLLYHLRPIGIDSEAVFDESATKRETKDTSTKTIPINGHHTQVTQTNSVQQKDDQAIVTEKNDEVVAENFENIKKRIIDDKNQVEKTCAKYLGSVDPWLPVRPHLNVQNYYLDNEKKRGYCVNAKVRENLIFI